MSNSNLNFMHFPENCRRSSVAFKTEIDGGNSRTLYAIAACNPNDAFCKKRGRQITEGRFKVGKVFELNLPTTSREAINRALAYVVQNQLEAAMYGRPFYEKAKFDEDICHGFED